MRFSIVILLVLGVIAAACASVLMGVLKIGTPVAGNTTGAIEVAMANASLPAMTPIMSEHISTEKVSRDELPQGQGKLMNSTGVIGRVLAMPVFEGQILTESCFVALGSGAQLAAQIPHGMRAITVPVSSKSMPDTALLYPGCIVDVVAVYRLSGQDSISTTMLRGIQVIGVDDKTIVSNPEGEENDENKTKRNSRGVSVTLLVTTKQVEGLQLAVENGIISLSIRNPLDKTEFEVEGTKLDKDRLAELGDVLEPTLPSGNESKLRMEEPNQPGRETTPNNQQQNTGKAPTDTGEQQQQKKQNGNIKFRKSHRWPVEVLRGREKTVEEFEATEAEPDKISPKK